MTTQTQGPETISRLANAVYPSFAALAAMELDVFTPLKDGPKRAEEIADALGVSAQKLRPLLYALVPIGLLSVDGDVFSNSDEAERFLVRGSPLYLGSRHELWSDLWGATLKTAASIRAGTPHDFSGMSQDELESFFRGLHPTALVTGRGLAKSGRFSSCKTLLDVGGGSGGFAIAATEECPHLRATVVDLSTVTPITRRFVDEAGAADRVDIVTADVVREPLQGSFDVAVLRALLQVLSPDEARQVLLNVSEVMEPRGVIYIVGRVLDDSRLTPAETVAFNLVFLNIYDDGQAHTDQEHRAWLEEAGFEEYQRASLPEGTSIVTARKRP
jgi:ubiquinone/menaquinone biosynthesis C-methylase UbiE